MYRNIPAKKVKLEYESYVDTLTPTEMRKLILEKNDVELKLRTQLRNLKQKLGVSENDKDPFSDRIYENDMNELKLIVAQQTHQITQSETRLEAQEKVIRQLQDEKKTTTLKIESLESQIELKNRKIHSLRSLKDKHRQSANHLKRKFRPDEATDIQKYT